MSISELAELVRRAQAGNATAMADLLRQIEPMLYYTALKMVGNVPDAEDLTQEAYVKVLEGLPSLRDPMTAPKWVKTIVVNLCRNQWKKKRPELFRTDEEEANLIGSLPEDETAAVPDLYMDMAAKRQIITRMIDALPEKQKLTVYLYYYDELTVEEIAQLMEVSTGTVKSRLSAARATLKAQVEEEERRGNKLYVIFPFLGRLLQEEAESLPLPPMPAAILERAGAKAVKAAGGKAAGGKAAKGAAKAGAGLGVKVAAGVVAAAVVVGAAVGIPAALRGTPDVPAAAPTEVVQPTPPPATPSPTPAPETTPEPPTAGFVPEDMLGQPLETMTDLFGTPTSQQEEYSFYAWQDLAAPHDFSVVLGSDGLIRQVDVSIGPAILGLHSGDSQSAAESALQALGHPAGVAALDAGAGQTTLSSPSADDALLYQVGCRDGSILFTSVQILG